MNKTELAAELATRMSLPKSQAGTIIETLFSDTGIIVSTIKAGEKVGITGFGTFQVAERAARKGINPKTKEPIDIAASKSVKFKAGKSSKEALA